MRIIATIEWEPITENDDLSVSYKSCARIDGDGTGPSHGDPDYQNATTLQHNGHSLNADVDKYIVVPPAIISGVAGIVLGSQAHCLNTLNGQECYAVVGDIGPHLKLGEVSIASAQALGIPSSPTTGGEERHVVRYTIRPGVAAVVDGMQYELQPSHAR